MFKFSRHFLIATLTVVIIFSSTFVAASQTVVWSDDFSNGCASNCIASTYGGWTIIDNDGGTTGGAPNNWFVSCAEEGITPPGCGSSCIGDQTLHIGANPGSGGDMGASFNETGATNATYRMAVSPTINTSGRSSLTLKFDFIAYGSAACSDDRAQLRLSFDNGLTWPLIYQYCLTSVCCGACNGYSLGQWTTYTMTLPAIFENNPNVRVGFHWRNNGNGSGTDPSVAIDDISVSSVVIVGVTLVKFDAAKESTKVKLKWVSSSENKLRGYEIERSSSAAGFQKITSVAARANQQPGYTNYEYNDQQLFPKPVFYRLKMLDLDGSYKYSSIVRVGSQSADMDEVTLLSASGKGGMLQLSLWSGYETGVAVGLYDTEGKKVRDLGVARVKKGESYLSYTIPRFATGNYILKVTSPKEGRKQAVDISRKILYTK